MMKIIIKWMFIVLILSIFILSAGLQLLRPSWFLVEVENIKLTPSIYAETSEAKTEPYYECIYTTTNKECKYVNLPKDKPYITQTPFAPLYIYKNYIIILGLIIMLILNRENIQTWIQKIRTSSN